MNFWNNFAAKHPAAAKWVREGGLFVQDLLRIVDHGLPGSGRDQAASVPQKQRGAEGALALRQEFAQRRGRKPQRLRGMGKTAGFRNGGQITVLPRIHVHTSHSFLQYTGFCGDWQGTVKKVL